MAKLCKCFNYNAYLSHTVSLGETCGLQLHKGAIYLLFISVAEGYLQKVGMYKSNLAVGLHITI